MPLIRKDASTTPAPSGEEALRRLAEGTTDERWAAARALGGGDARAVRALASALPDEPDRRVREAILTGLARAGTAEALDAVLPLLRSDDAERRTAALDAMRAMPGATLLRLPELLDDADPDVRLLACELARQAPGDQAQDLLCALLERDPEVNVCAAAVEVLAEVGDARALPALQRCAERHGGAPFLGYAIKAATHRIASQAAPPGG
jgi:HEAT repeat protein